MAFVNKLFETNFIEYASYVIKERAIPHLDDGLKPVQRRIMHSLFDVDDGKFHKVANVVGHCMQYHPHGDSSIYEALVNMANKVYFIDRQGNFGNIMTGDPASAARYIECRVLPFAKDILYNPEITDFVDSYDGRRKEPIVFPCKIPLPIVLGAEGIAVGMSTRILPHNILEVIEAEIACLEGREFELLPDFQTGGLVDVTDYNQGNGKVLSRAKLNTKDSKKIIIEELPYGSTTESLIASIESAARKNKIKIGSISDFTTDKVEIEIKLPRGVHTRDVVDGLYAFTDCETSVSVNLLMIKDDKPVVMKITEVIEYHAKRLVGILKKELELEQQQLWDKHHARTLERIFIEERIYKRIEEMKTREAVFMAVHDGFKPFLKELLRPVTDEDVERLLKIPIRRISLYDMSKNLREIQEIEARLKEIAYHLKHLTEYAIGFLTKLTDKLNKEDAERKTEVMSLSKVSIQDAAQRNLKLRYNDETGYLGYDVSNGNLVCDVSQYDKLVIIRKDATYSGIYVPDKLFVGKKGLLYVGLADKETTENTVFSVIYKNTENNYPYIKRFKITQFILNNIYPMLPEEGKLVKFTDKQDVSAVIDFQQKSLLKMDEHFPVDKYLVKGVKARGVRIKPKEFRNGKFVKTKTMEAK